VIAWSTIRILLALVLQEGWTTRQGDYDNPFGQAELSETVFVEQPKLFGPKSGKDHFLNSKEFIWTQESSKNLLRKTKLDYWNVDFNSQISTLVSSSKMALYVWFMQMILSLLANGEEIENEIATL